ncbi:uncharacterized protein SPSK_05760 [Sporothrix schenckii 1099-18]|uniref:Secreted protein n=1 Tax=Sporothrix schenckii 1099-18 TaxID=1397361 RepID=A0A0F2LWS4_SPOSC|nr:uncharacterized protein SPSK_05760 [Sporothrix schenckii 1099-18]KJR80356.1 hypothetical protein SPSK_05760 [Sporothrix schenckii 1099-18]
MFWLMRVASVSCFCGPTSENEPSEVRGWHTESPTGDQPKLLSTKEKGGMKVHKASSSDGAATRGELTTQLCGGLLGFL